MTIATWTAGLTADKEAAVLSAPTEPFWSENLLFTPYDPATGLCGWLHLGTMPNEWEFWEDRVMVGLPGDQGVMSMWACHKTATELKPGGSNLFFSCQEPFRRWKIVFDGWADHHSQHDMTKGGLAPVSGPKRRMTIELDVECASPVWDAAKGHGDLSKQGWGTDHYEQMFRARGTVKVGDEEWPFSGMGWRDHSRGPRGAGTGAPWGGHVIVGGLWPSGRSVMFSRYHTPDGTISLEGGNIGYEDGSAHPAALIETPRLRELLLHGEEVTASLTCDRGPVNLTLRPARSIWTSMQNKVVVGTDMSGNGSHYVLNFGECLWDGEAGHFYMERSDLLSRPPEVLIPTCGDPDP